MGESPETFWKKKRTKFIMGIILVLFLFSRQVDNSLTVSDSGVSLESSDFQQESVLDVEVILNQTAYLPNSDANVTLKLHNNHTSTMTSVNITATLPEEMELLQGSISVQNQIINSGDNLTCSFICKIPDQVASLDLVFLIDSSGSMSEELDEVKDEVSNLIAEIDPLVSSLRIGFIMFGSTLFDENPDDDVRNIMELTSNSEAIDSFISQFSASGSWEPWGDAIYLLKNMNWESTGRLAILITDEPCNGGHYVGGPSHDYYYGPELEQTVEQIHEMGIVISAMQAYGGGPTLTEQLQMVAEVGGGSFVELSSSSSELIEQAIIMAEDVIAEIGLKIIVNFEANLDGEIEQEEEIKWVLVDNLPPSLVGSAVPYFVNDGDGLTMKYKILCSVFDAAGVSEVNLFYRNDTGSFQSTLMSKVTPSLFEFLLPQQDEGTTVEFYFHASDILGSSTTTDVESFVVDYSLPELELGHLSQTSLSSGAYMVYTINETITNESILGVFSNNKLEFQLYETENNSLVDHSSMKPFHCTKFYDDFDGYLLLQNPMEYPSAAILFFDSLAREVDLFMQETEVFQETIEFGKPLIYKVTNIGSTDDWIHISINGSNQFQFLELLCFSGNESLKHRIFNVLSVESNSIDEAYFVVMPTDSRIDSSESSTIEIGYGFIPDDPYWGAPEAVIPGYEPFLMIGVILITLVLIIKKLTKKK